MNTMTNAQLWHRRLKHLNKRSLELMQRRDGNGVTFRFNRSLRRLRRGQLAHPKEAKVRDIMAPFQLVYGDLMRPFIPGARGGYEYVSTNGSQSTCSAPRTKPSHRYSYSSLQLSLRSAAVSTLGEPIRAVNTPAKTSKRVARR